MKENSRSSRLRVNLLFGSGNNTVGVTIQRIGSSRFALEGILNPAEAAGFMNYILTNDLTDEQLETRAYRYGLREPLR